MTGPRYSQAGVQALKHGEAVTLTPASVRGMVPREGEAAYRSGGRIVPARQAERLLAAVDALPPRHDCPSLANCLNHPRWHVWRDIAWDNATDSFAAAWVATPQMAADGRVNGFERDFPTHAEALSYATERARADALAHLEAQPGEVCS